MKYNKNMHGSSSERDDRNRHECWRKQTVGQGGWASAVWWRRMLPVSRAMSGRHAPAINSLCVYTVNRSATLNGRNVYSNRVG